MKNRLISIVLSLLTLFGCGDGSSDTIDTAQGGDAANGAGIPGLDRWESQMKAFGEVHCQGMRDGRSDFDSRLAATYYDAQRVYYQMADYTGDSTWTGCALTAQKIYRDQYVIANNGKVPGYWNFSAGLLMGYQRNHDSASKRALQMLSRDAAFASDSTPPSETQSAELSREVAYLIEAYLNSEGAGFARRPRLKALVDQALGHLDQWFFKRSAAYVRPFMFALTAEALIQYQQSAPDPRIVSALTKAADAVWTRLWLQNSQAFKYTDRSTPSGGEEPAPDLNLLIAPVFAWLYQQTGEPRFRERGDDIFLGGVKSAYLAGAKQFNQNYRWSFDYIKWRGGSQSKAKLKIFFQPDNLGLLPPGQQILMGLGGRPRPPV